MFFKGRFTSFLFTIGSRPCNGKLGSTYQGSSICLLQCRQTRLVTSGSIRGSSHLLDIGGIRVSFFKTYCTLSSHIFVCLIGFGSILFVGQRPRGHNGVPKGDLSLSIKINYRRGLVYVYYFFLWFLSGLLLTLGCYMFQYGIIFSIGQRLYHQRVPCVPCKHNCVMAFSRVFFGRYHLIQQLRCGGL